MGKGENAAFSPFPQMFLKFFSVRVIKTQDFVVQGLKEIRQEQYFAKISREDRIDTYDKKHTLHAIRNCSHEKYPKITLYI